MFYFNGFAALVLFLKWEPMCHCNLLLFFRFLFVLCWCRRRQAKDQRSWKYALKTLPAPLGGCWAEVKKNPFCWCSLYVAEDLISEEFPSPLKKNLWLEIFFEKEKKKFFFLILNISSFFKWWDYVGHFKNDVSIKNFLGPAQGPAVGWALAAWSHSRGLAVCLTWNQNGPCQLNHHVCSQRTRKKTTEGSSNSPNFRLLDQLYKNS